MKMMTIPSSLNFNVCVVSLLHSNHTPSKFSCAEILIVAIANRIVLIVFMTVSLIGFHISYETITYKSSVIFSNKH